MKCLLILLCLAVVLASSCAMAPTDIGTIKDDPEEFRGETVLVKGRINSIVAIPVVGLRAFEVRDDDASIWVIGAAPGQEGDLVSVKGEVDVAVRLGDMNLGTVIRLPEAE